MIEIFMGICGIVTLIVFMSVLLGLFTILCISVSIVTKYICSYLIPILKPYFLQGEYGYIISENSLFITVWLVIGSILGIASFFKIFNEK